MHISEAELILFLENKLPVKTRRRVEQHLSDCERCSADIAAIKRLDKVFADSSAPTIEPSVLERAGNLSAGRTARFFLIRGTARYAIAASIILAVGIGTIVLLRRPPKISEFRRPGESAPAFNLLPEDGTAVSTVHFQWSRIPHARVYNVCLLEENGRILRMISTPDTNLTISSEVVLQPGKRYLWKVEAFLPDETKLGSKLHVFTYSP